MSRHQIHYLALLLLVVLSTNLGLNIVHGGSVDKLREMMIFEYERNPSLYDLEDIERIKNPDDPWTVERYLLVDRNVTSEAFKHMKRVLKWRKESNINKLTAKDFPCEFIYSELVQVVVDRKKRPVILFDLSVNRRFPDVANYIAFFVHWLTDILDKESHSSGVGMIVPMGHLAVTNFDVQVTREYFPLLDRFPHGLRYVLMHDAGLILGSAVRLMLSWMDERMQSYMHVTDGQEMFRWIKKRNLPKFCGGILLPVTPTPHVPNPHECASIWSVARRLGWSRSNVETYLESVGPRVRKNRSN